MPSQLILFLTLLIFLVIIGLSIVVTTVWMIFLYQSKVTIPSRIYDELLKKFVYVSSDEATLNEVVAYGLSYYEGHKQLISSSTDSSLNSVKTDVFNKLKHFSNSDVRIKSTDTKLEVLAFLHQEKLISDDEYTVHRHKILSSI